MDDMLPEELPAGVGEADVAEVREATDPVYEPIAPWWHTALVLTELVVLALIGPAIEQARLSEPHLFRYTAGIMAQCLQLGAVVAGLYHRRRFFLDTLRGGAGTWRTEAWRGVALYLGTLLMFAVAAKLLQVAGLRPHYDPSVINAMAPTGALELLAWLCVSVVVGFCEEHVFRGYLLQQMLAWARGKGASPMVAASSAVILTSVLFGSLHVYEGVGGAILIGILGAMYAAVALRRGNLRAVIVAHVLQDFMTVLFIMGRHAHAGR
jgi:membrane protease YdiL (CAAX protease family)